MSLQTGTRDMLIELIKSELYHGFALGLPETYASTMRRIEQMIDDHRKVQDDTTVTSKLKERVPTVGKFHTSLPLEERGGATTRSIVSARGGMCRRHSTRCGTR